MTRFIRIYWKRLGGHIHCRVFTTGKNGDLVFDTREWPEVLLRLEKIAEVKEEE